MDTLELLTPFPLSDAQSQEACQRLSEYWKGMFQQRRIVKVMLAIPSEGTTDNRAYSNHLDLSLHLGCLSAASHLGVKNILGVTYEYPTGIELAFYHVSVGRALTPLARERLAEYALAFQMDYLWFLDNDMVVPVDLFERLFRHHVEVVAALAFTRNAPHKPVLYKVNSGFDPVEHKPYFQNVPIFNYPKDRLVECDAVGFGSVLIDCRVFQKCSPPYFMSTTSAGEDIWFCWNAKKAGVRIFMDTSVKLGHLAAPQEITEEVYEHTNGMEHVRRTYPVVPLPTPAEAMAS